MTDEHRSSEALECGHCGAKNRMLILASDTESEPVGDGTDFAPFDQGTLYEVQKCPACDGINLIAGFWHSEMESKDDWRPTVVLPKENDLEARRVFQSSLLDQKCMRLAVTEARKSVPESPDKPKVGAVVSRGDEIVRAAYRGEIKAGEHAEYTLLEGKCKDEILTGATVFTTLEPCTTRTCPKIPCVERLVGRKVGRVVIGMLDPDERIRGRGVLALRKANIRVDLFPPELMAELEEMNRDFIASRERPASAPTT